MKLVKNIISLVLVLTVINTIVGKSIHEVLFHNHQEIHCEATTTQHFHEQKSPSADLLCSFNFSSTLITLQTNLFSGIFGVFKTIKITNFRYELQNQFLTTLTLRGPPIF